jgi:hypothetical protein
MSPDPENLATATIRSALCRRPRRGRRHRARRLLLQAAALLALALASAGCGGSSSPSVAHVGTTNASSPSNGPVGGTPESDETIAAAQQKLVKFAQCMRTHGEPEFPEPVEGHIALHASNGSRPNPESPQFRAAEKACNKYAPAAQAPSPQQQAKMREQALKFSECMRQHGVPNFPDPKFSGGGTRVTLKLGKSGGIEPNSPQFQAAQKACQSDSPLGRVSGKGLPPAAQAPGGGGQSGEATMVAP